MNATPSQRWVVQVDVTLDGRRIAGGSVLPGGRLRVGREGDVVVPTPDGVEGWIDVDWARSTASATPSVLVAGRSAVALTRDAQLTVRAGAMRVEVAHQPRWALRRAGTLAWAPAVAWFLIVFAMSVASAQAYTLWSMRCVLFGVGCPAPEPQATGGWNAEYLARLIREDVDGDVDGVIEAPTPEASVPVREDVPAYVPVGDAGPTTTHGGGANVGPTTSTRDAVKPQAAAAAQRSEGAVQGAPEGTPVRQPLTDRAEGEGVDPDALALEGQDARAPGTGRTELREGWGVRDWIRAAPPTDRAELARRANTPRRRLAIDPDDPRAISLLAYYQYLQEDYDAAIANYDRLIDLEPEESSHYNNKALIYKRRGEFAREEGLYRLALAMSPEDVVVMDNLALNLAHQGKFAEAWRWMEKVGKLDPGDCYAELHRSKIAALEGREGDALAYLERALRGLAQTDIMHHIEFRADVRLDPAFARLRADEAFLSLLERYDEAIR
jgi:tetratricopeptide (TPR) repeat protein